MTWSTFRPAVIKSTSQADFTLNVAMTYQIVQAVGERGPFKVTTVGYAYSICELDETEVVLHHWHPWVPDEPDFHFHVGGGQLDKDGTLSRKMQIIGGRTSMEDVILFCIRSLGAKTLRPDWESVLSASRARYETWKTQPAQKSA